MLWFAQYQIMFLSLCLRRGPESADSYSRSWSPSWS